MILFSHCIVKLKFVTRSGHGIYWKAKKEQWKTPWLIQRHKQILSKLLKISTEILWDWFFFSEFLHVFKCKHVFEGKIFLRLLLLLSLAQDIGIGCEKNENLGTLHSRNTRNVKSVPVNMVTQNLFE